MRRTAVSPCSLVHAAAERADLRTGVVGAAQQLLRAQRRVLGPVLVLDAMTAARLAQVLAQQLAGAADSSSRTCRTSHCTCTRRPIQPGGAP